MSTGGEVANALVCKTSIRGFNSLPVLHLSFSPLRTRPELPPGSVSPPMQDRRVLWYLTQAPRHAGAGKTGFDPNFLPRCAREVRVCAFP
jgi:hypothetical protein